MYDFLHAGASHEPKDRGPRAPPADRAASAATMGRASGPAAEAVAMHLCSGWGEPRERHPAKERCPGHESTAHSRPAARLQKDRKRPSALPRGQGTRGYGESGLSLPEGLPPCSHEALYMIPRAMHAAPLRAPSVLGRRGD